MRKVHTSSVNSSSALFSCSIHSMYNIVNRSQKQHLMLKSYIPGINLLIGPRRNYDPPPENIVNKLHVWIEKYPHVI